MASLPLIPVLVLVGGAGSSIFILTKVKIEKRSLEMPAALTMLLGPGLAVSIVCVLLAITESPARRLAYICHGHAPATASHVQITGYSTFLGEEWLATFNIGEKDFQSLVAQAELVPADGFEFETVLRQSAVNPTKRLQTRLPSQNLLCFKRIFNPATERERGRIYAVFDPATSTAVVFRQHHD